MSKRTSWWWVRHAPVTSTGGRIYGNTDPDANVEDPPTYKALASFLPKNAILITSNLKRTKQTADAIKAAGLFLPEAIVENNLGEQNFGEWQGKIREEVYATLNPKHLFWLASAHTKAPNGESFIDLTHRVSLIIKNLTKLYAGKNIISVGHGGVIRAAIGHALNLDPEVALSCQIDNCSITRLDYFEPTESHPNGAWAVFHINHHVTSKSVLEADHTAMLALLKS